MKRPEWLDTARDAAEGFAAFMAVPVVLGTACGIGLGCLWGGFRLVVFLVEKITGG